MRSQTPRRGAVRYSDPVVTPFSEMHRPRPADVPAQPRREQHDGWGSFGEFAHAVANVARERVNDPRLVRAPSGLNEADPAGGGFVVPPVYAEGIVGSIYQTGAIAARVDRRTSDRALGEVYLPAIDETSRADGSRFGGALAYWSAEAATITSTFPRWRRLSFTGRKIIAVSYGTRELDEDSELFGESLRDSLMQETTYKAEEAIVAGDGVGKPLGVLHSPALLTVAKETGQAAATIVAANVTNMYDVLVADARRNAAWLVNPDCEPQLRSLALVVGTGGAPLWQWSGEGQPRLLGLPVIATEHNPALGAVGDIILADLSQYVLVDQPPKDALSLDAALLSDQVIFRMTYRCDGKTKYASAITPANSATQRSPFITLAART
jgi:HK97 family phage major capsid protein